MSDSTDTPTGIGRRARAADSALTERQRTILEVIRASVTSRGYPPSIREIGDAVGLTSTSSVAHRCARLSAKAICDATRIARGRSTSAEPTTPQRLFSPTFPARTPCPNRHSSPCWAASRRVGRFWPRKPSKTCFRCRVSWSVRVRCSCCGSSATRWSTPRSATATGWWCASKTWPTTATSSQR
ncbi:LexA repressor [Mycobacterium xenopi RIVM700367]|nr:LexA repressor [Mycobacterium xenopi RIVM700367]